MLENSGRMNLYEAIRNNGLQAKNEESLISSFRNVGRFASFIQSTGRQDILDAHERSRINDILTNTYVAEDQKAFDKLTEEDSDKVEQNPFVRQLHGYGDKAESENQNKFQLDLEILEQKNYYIEHLASCPRAGIKTDKVGPPDKIKERPKERELLTNTQHLSADSFDAFQHKMHEKEFGGYQITHSKSLPKLQSEIILTDKESEDDVCDIQQYATPFRKHSDMNHIAQGTDLIENTNRNQEQSHIRRRSQGYNQNEEYTRTASNIANSQADIYRLQDEKYSNTQNSIMFSKMNKLRLQEEEHQSRTNSNAKFSHHQQHKSSRLPGDNRTQTDSLVFFSRMRKSQVRDELETNTCCRKQEMELIHGHKSSANGTITPRKSRNKSNEMRVSSQGDCQTRINELEPGLETRKQMMYSQVVETPGRQMVRHHRYFQESVQPDIITPDQLVRGKECMEQTFGIIDEENEEKTVNRYHARIKLETHKASFNKTPDQGKRGVCDYQFETQDNDDDQHNVSNTHRIRDKIGCYEKSTDSIQDSSLQCTCQNAYSVQRDRSRTINLFSGQQSTNMVQSSGVATATYQAGRTMRMQQNVMSSTKSKQSTQLQSDQKLIQHGYHMSRHEATNTFESRNTSKLDENNSKIKQVINTQNNVGDRSQIRYSKYKSGCQEIVNGESSDTCDKGELEVQNQKQGYRKKLRNEMMVTGESNDTDNPQLILHDPIRIESLINSQRLEFKSPICKRVDAMIICESDGTSIVNKRVVNKHKTEGMDIGGSVVTSNPSQSINQSEINSKRQETQEKDKSQRVEMKSPIRRKLGQETLQSDDTNKLQINLHVSAKNQTDEKRAYYTNQYSAARDFDEEAYTSNASHQKQIRRQSNYSVNDESQHSHVATRYRVESQERIYGESVVTSNPERDNLIRRETNGTVNGKSSQTSNPEHRKHMRAQIGGDYFGESSYTSNYGKKHFNKYQRGKKESGLGESLGTAHQVGQKSLIRHESGGQQQSQSIDSSDQENRLYNRRDGEAIIVGGSIQTSDPERSLRVHQKCPIHNLKDGKAYDSNETAHRGRKFQQVIDFGDSNQTSEHEISPRMHTKAQTIKKSITAMKESSITSMGEESKGIRIKTTENDKKESNITSDRMYSLDKIKDNKKVVVLIDSATAEDSCTNSKHLGVEMQEGTNTRNQELRTETQRQSCGSKIRKSRSRHSKQSFKSQSRKNEASGTKNSDLEIGQLRASKRSSAMSATNDQLNSNSFRGECSRILSMKKPVRDSAMFLMPLDESEDSRENSNSSVRMRQNLQEFVNVNFIRQNIKKVQKISNQVKVSRIESSDVQNTSTFNSVSNINSSRKLDLLVNRFDKGKKELIINKSIKGIQVKKIKHRTKIENILKQIQRQNYKNRDLLQICEVYERSKSSERSQRSSQKESICSQTQFKLAPI